MAKSILNIACDQWVLFSIVLLNRFLEKSMDKHESLRDLDIDGNLKYFDFSLESYTILDKNVFISWKHLSLSNWSCTSEKLLLSCNCCFPFVALQGLRRSEAFTKDLNYHYGNDGSWQEKAESTPAVKNYIEHLKEIEGENPLILAAYIYHLYMGLLSGGQILAKKRGVKSSLGLGKDN